MVAALWMGLILKIKNQLCLFLQGILIYFMGQVYAMKSKYLFIVGLLYGYTAHFRVEYGLTWNVFSQK